MNSAIDMGFAAQAFIADVRLTNQDILDAVSLSVRGTPWLT